MVVFLFADRGCASGRGKGVVGVVGLRFGFLFSGGFAIASGLLVALDLLAQGCGFAVEGGELADSGAFDLGDVGSVFLQVGFIEFCR